MALYMGPQLDGRLLDEKPLTSCSCTSADFSNVSTKQLLPRPDTNCTAMAVAFPSELVGSSPRMLHCQKLSCCWPDPTRQGHPSSPYQKQIRHITHVLCKLVSGRAWFRSRLACARFSCSHPRPCRGWRPAQIGRWLTGHTVEWKPKSTTDYCIPQV